MFTGVSLFKISQVEVLVANHGISGSVEASRASVNRTITILCHNLYNLVSYRFSNNVMSKLIDESKYDAVAMLMIYYAMYDACTSSAICIEQV